MIKRWIYSAGPVLAPTTKSAIGLHTTNLGIVRCFKTHNHTSGMTASEARKREPTDAPP